jgi:hypothetical protein
MAINELGEVLDLSPRLLGGLFRSVELAQGNDLLDVVRSVEPLFLKLGRVEIGLGSQAQEGMQEGLLTRLVAMSSSWCSVSLAPFPSDFSLLFSTGMP